MISTNRERLNRDYKYWMERVESEKKLVALHKRLQEHAEQQARSCGHKLGVLKDLNHHKHDVL